MENRSLDQANNFARASMERRFERIRVGNSSALSKLIDAKDLRGFLMMRLRLASMVTVTGQEPSLINIV